MNRCIACKKMISSKVLMRIDNMPSCAQNIPSIDEADDDKPITVDILACPYCGLVQLGSEPVSYYRDVIRSGGISTTMAELRRAQYSKWIKDCNLTGKKIIEVGCGAGEFLSILNEYDVDARGLEHKKDLVEKAVAAGLKVYKGYTELEGYVIPDSPYDAFTSFNYLEHQPNPDIYLKAIANNLVDGGYGLITVPSLEYILEQKSFYEIIPDHIAYYTEDSLTNLLNSSGFRVLSIERINRDTLSAVVKKKKPVDLTELKKEQEYIQKDVDSFIENASNKGKSIAVWGASHQGFTLCSVTGLRGRVKYIIDSAPFKQGKVAPASHINIISPETALKDPTDIILIVAPGYTDEIADIIRKSYKTDVEIYTIRSNRIEKL